MKPGDTVWVRVTENGRQHVRMGVVSSHPEHGYVSVRGLPGRAGAVSVRRGDVWHSAPPHETSEERLAYLMKRWDGTLAALAKE